jgi:hypothetical protein
MLREAISAGVCVRAIYNGGEVVLRPYAIFDRHDAIFLRAVTESRDGRPPRELKLSTFRLSGLSRIASTGIAFEPDPVFAALARQSVLSESPAAEAEDAASGFRS